jgi:ribonucleoside-diphosphate reductase alpha chain
MSDNKIENTDVSVKSVPIRQQLPDDRRSLNHRFRVGLPGDGLHASGYLILGMYPTGEIGELFVKLKRIERPIKLETIEEYQERIRELYAFMHGVMDSLAISVSLGLQYGIPIDEYINKFKYARYPPQGSTRNREIPFAKSLVDYIFTYIDKLIKK